MTAVTANLSDLFDQHAKLVIDDWTYHSNPILKDAADRIFALVGLKATDIQKSGVEVFRRHAIIHAFDRTADGEKIVQDGKHAVRTIVVDLVTGEV
jgi:hypothetical protein